MNFLILYEESKMKKEIARKELEEDRYIINKFMEKYGEEWRKLGEE